jgi:hypothetical protein
MGAGVIGENMADLTTLKTRLAEAEDAEHKLVCGAHAVAVDYDGQKVSFQAAGINQLRLYIARLKADIDKLEGVARGGSRRMVATF